MRLKQITIICSILLLFTIMGVSAYSTYGAPSEFGNDTTTTCWIGGDYGELICIGNVSAPEFCLNGTCRTSWPAAGSYPGDIFVNESGDTMTGDLDMGGNKLTDVGELIMSGLMQSYDVIPITTSIYSLGNSTNRFGDAWIDRVHATNVTANYLNSDNVDSSDINISDNLTVDGYEIREESDWLIFKLK